EIIVYNRSLSAEQVRALYANRTDIIVSQNTRHFENWSACVTPNDGSVDGSTKCTTQNVTIVNTQPNLTRVDINTTDPTKNTTDENITIYPRSVLDLDTDNVKNITNWYEGGISWSRLNMPFEGGSTSAFTRDYSGTNNSGRHNGTIRNGAVYNSNGGVDGFGAYEFDGLKDYVEIASTDAIEYRGGNLTLVAWVKPTAGENSSGEIISKPWNAEGEYNYRMTRLANGGIQANLGGNTSSSITASVNVTGEDWWHVVITVDSLRNTSIYINGVINASATHTILNWTPVSGDANTALAIGTLYPYGEGSSNFVTGFSFNGTIDDVLILNKSLSPEQVRELYNNRTDLILAQETQRSETWQACVTPNDRSVDGSTVCSANLTLNTPPTTPVLQIPPDGNTSTNRTPFFNWTASTDADSDSITYILNITCIGGCTSDNRYVAGITNNNYTLTSPLQFFSDDGYSYNWTVLAYDGKENSSWATEFSFEIDTYVAIILNSSNITFGNVTPGFSDDTSDNSPQPFVLQNEGNIEIDLNVSATDLWESDPNPTNNYQYKADNTTIEPNAFNVTGSNITYVAMPDTNPNKFVDHFNWSDSNDTLEVDINITVPSNEGAGNKTSIVTFTAFRS
ncbi:MAG: LamG domain-containing protein, partial [Candidatus Nanoarchaeia archaeon]|nr:LamG domain-containing protein [Candidatus Nanoarchaeia archaeon]